MAKPTKPLIPPGLPGKPGGLGQKVEETVERFFAWLFNEVIETFTGWLTWGLEQFMHFLRPGALRVFGPFLRFVRDREGCPPEFKELIDHALDEDGEFGVAALGMLGTSAGGAFIGSITSSLFAPITYGINRVIHPARPEPSAAAAMIYRDMAASGLLKDYLFDLGWTEDMIGRWMDILRPRLGPAELFAAEYRFGESLAATEEELRKRGYPLNDITIARALTQMIPGPGDLIRMAVREAWRDDVAAEWGYDADFPPEFAEWMEKQGDTEGWSRKYWRAHWELPGLTTVLDILYRVPEFDMANLDTFLRISDIPATWRDYIKRTAYRPLTRVDVRRMYGMGVLDRAAVKRSYLDLGYDDTNAERMTEFTVRYETEDDRAATKADILSFLNVGAITSSEAVTWLREIGYPEELASYLVARELMKAEQKRVAQQVKHIRNLYIHNELTPSEASSRMGAIGVPAGEIQNLLDEWDIDRAAKVQRPSRATLDRLLQQDVISESEYTNGLVALGYQDRYVNWYLSSILQKKAEETRKEEEKARDEQEAIRKRRIKSDYQITKAQLDVDISEIQTAISETQLALRERQIRYQEELRVAREALTVAELQGGAARDIANLEAQIKDQESAIAFLREQIEVLETDIADIRLKGLPQPKPLTAGEAAVAIREREVEIENLKVQIEAIETEIAEIEIAVSPEVATITPELAEAAILERQLAIERLQDDMAILEVEMSEIRLTRAITVAELTAEEVERQIKVHQAAIELAQDDIAGVHTSIATLRSQIHQRRVQLTEDLQIVVRIRSIEEVEAGWQADLLEMTLRLSGLRANLSELREQKAQLAVEYRVGLAEE